MPHSLKVIFPKGFTQSLAIQNDMLRVLPKRKLFESNFESNIVRATLRATLRVYKKGPFKASVKVLSGFYSHGFTLRVYTWKKT